MHIFIKKNHFDNSNILVGTFSYRNKFKPQRFLLRRILKVSHPDDSFYQLLSIVVKYFIGGRFLPSITVIFRFRLCVDCYPLLVNGHPLLFRQVLRTLLRSFFHNEIFTINRICLYSSFSIHKTIFCVTAEAVNPRFYFSKNYSRKMQLTHKIK